MEGEQVYERLCTHGRSLERSRRGHEGENECHVEMLRVPGKSNIEQP